MKVVGLNTDGTVDDLTKLRAEQAIEASDIRFYVDDECYPGTTKDQLRDMLYHALSELQRELY